MITREKLKKLNKENLIELILEMSELLTENQNRKYNQIVAGYLTDQSVNSHDGDRKSTRLNSSHPSSSRMPSSA